MRPQGQPYTVYHCSLIINETFHTGRSKSHFSSSAFLCFFFLQHKYVNHSDSYVF